MLTAGLFWLAFGYVARKNVSPLLETLLIGGGVALLIGVAYGFEAILKATGRRGDWLSAPAIGALFGATVATSGLWLAVATVVAPSPATEQTAGQISRDTAHVRAVVDRLLPDGPAAVRAALGGKLFGEPGCAVAYRFTLADAAITVDRVRSPGDAPALHLEGTVLTNATADIRVAWQSPERARDTLTTFGYWTDGRAEELSWEDHARRSPIRLVRCSG